MGKLVVTALVVGVLLPVLVPRAYAGPPTYKEALRLCEEEYRNCTGISGLKANPYRSDLFALGGCDFNKQEGHGGIQVWKQCREWCETQHNQCTAEAADAFREQETPRSTR